MKPIRFALDEELPDPCQDAVFKALMTKDSPPSRGARNGLLSAILGQPVTVISSSPNEPPVSGLHDRQIRFDLNVRLAGGELANVEMTKDPAPDEALRMEYYIARLYAGQEIRGAGLEYQDLKKTWQISLLAHRNLFSGGALVHRFRYYDREQGQSLNGRTEIITVELKKADEAVEGDLAGAGRVERWAYFFLHLADKGKRGMINRILAAEEEIGMAGEVVQGFTKDELELFHQISKDKWQTDMQSRLAYAREEAREAGRAEGLEAGRVEGLEAGRAETVKLMRKHGMSPGQIAETLELPPDFVLACLKAG
jgi:predicted transposase/invertase (TIGR01784 family)